MGYTTINKHTKINLTFPLFLFKRFLFFLFLRLAYRQTRTGQLSTPARKHCFSSSSSSSFSFSPWRDKRTVDRRPLVFADIRRHRLWVGRRRRRRTVCRQSDIDFVTLLWSVLDCFPCLAVSRADLHSPVHKLHSQ